VLIDRTKLQMLATNASIYGVHPSKLLLVLADAKEIMKDYYKQGNLIQRSNDDYDQKVEGTSEELVPQIQQMTNNDDTEDKPPDNDVKFPICGVESLPPSIHAIYLSPPWGGPSYIHNSTNDNNSNNNKKTTKPSLNLQNDMADAITLLQLAANAIDQNIIYFLPKNIHGISLGKAVATLPKPLRRKGIELEQNYINGKLKTVTAYIGMFKFQS
jgi:hypothetical protein